MTSREKRLCVRHAHFLNLLEAKARKQLKNIQFHFPSRASEAIFSIFSFVKNIKEKKGKRAHKTLKSIYRFTLLHIYTYSIYGF